MTNRSFTWSNNVFNAGNLAAFTLAVALLALVFWWIVLVRRRHVWFPILRRLDIPPKVTPRLRMEPPPLIPFLCFLVAAASATILAFEPGRVEWQANNSAAIDSHLLIDLSPSVARMPLPELATLAADTWESLSRDGKVTIGLTSGVASGLKSAQAGDDDIASPASREDVVNLVSKAGFARAGVRLAGALQKQLANTGKIDRVVILSDDDAHSWGGLNSGFFRGRGALNRVPVRAAPDTANLFIESVRKTSGFSRGAGVMMDNAPGAGREAWEVEILRRRRDDATRFGANPGSAIPVAGLPEISGTLEVLAGDKVAGRATWNLAAAAQRLLVSVEVDAAKEIAGVAGAADVLEFRLDTEVPDAIKMDNQFRARRDLGPGSVRLISEPRGEGLLQDDAWQLATVLGIMGYEVRRHDSAAAAAAASARANRWVIQVGGAGHLENVCPSWFPARLTHASTVWLAPRGGGIDVSWSDLCMCYARLTGTENPGRFCGEVTSRQGWIGLLPSLGAKQVGGRLGEETGSIAWRGGLAGSDASVMAYTLPLEPSIATGVDHARFPLLLKGLIELEEGATRQVVSSWPRISDSSAAGVRARDLPLSNVPSVESVLQVAAPSDLPPVYNARFPGRDKAASDAGNGNLDERINPWPWVRGLAATAAGAVIFEAAWMTGKWVLARGFFTAGIFLIAFLGAMAASAFSGLARADVEIIFANPGPASGTGARFSRLAREVASRTSIMLVPVARVWNPSSLDVGPAKPAGIDQPWLWSDGLKGFVDKSGRLSPVTGRWLRRGGFLVIEGISSREALDAAFKIEFPGTTWAPVPTDHELMRSFYLLDGLPACAPAIWHQFTFDGRVAAVAMPRKMSDLLRDGAPADAFRCPGDQRAEGPEKGYRAFVNLLMVALTTDYKKDQVHLPEILKRLR